MLSLEDFGFDLDVYKELKIKRFIDELFKEEKEKKKHDKSNRAKTPLSHPS